MIYDWQFCENLALYLIHHINLNDNSIQSLLLTEVSKTCRKTQTIKHTTQMKGISTPKEYAQQCLQTAMRWRAHTPPQRGKKRLNNGGVHINHRSLLLVVRTVWHLHITFSLHVSTSASILPLRWSVKLWRQKAWSLEQVQVYIPPCFTFSR